MLRHAGRVHCVAVTPDGQQIVTGGGDGTAKLWDAASGELRCTLKGHTGSILSGAVTPDGRRVVTGSEDGTTRLWDAISGRELLVLNGHGGSVWAVAVTPGGRRLVTGSDDGIVRIWEAASSEQIWLWARREKDDARRLAEAARHFASWQRPAAGATGFIQDWLVLAPLHLKDAQTGAKGLQLQQLEGEAELQPRAGEQIRVDGREYTWQAYHEKEPILDFNRFVGKLSANSVAYAVCYVISAAEQRDVLLQVGSDDQAKVYFNGQEVYKHTLSRELLAVDPVGPVTLRKGTNVLVLKVVNEMIQWEGCARFVDLDGNPIPGLQVRLTPE
jgi:hypothetical protein